MTIGVTELPPTKVFTEFVWDLDSWSSPTLRRGGWSYVIRGAVRSEV